MSYRAVQGIELSRRQRRGVSWVGVSAPAQPSESPLPGWIKLWLVAVIVLRLGYHVTYFGEVPFPLAPLSDGALYETMALDILAAPPWGTAPFYLQGVYAYQVALGYAITGQPTGALFVQLLLAAAAWGALFRALQAIATRRVAAIVVAFGMSYPGFAFYANKHLTASLAVVSFMLMLGATAWMLRRRTWHGALALGLTTALAILARSNAMLCVPFAAWAVVLAARHHRVGAGKWAAVFGLGLLLGLAPMAVRNQIVTGEATIAPAHGGGTSFYIGNNAHARGVWNDAGGLISGDVSHERSELARRLGVDETDPAKRAKAIGRALYAKALREIADAPGRWLWLEVRKGWLLVGNDELTQDYDHWGERELVGAAFHFGVPFSWVLALGAVAFVAARGRGRSLSDRVWLWVCLGETVAVLAANFGFFTSSQHRLPLAVPLLAYAAWAWPEGAWREGTRRTRTTMAIVGALVVAQGWLPRAKDREPSAVHYFNLALAQKRVGEPRAAYRSLSKAVQMRPDQAVIRIERATVARELGDFVTAKEDIAILSARDDLPAWVQARYQFEVEFLATVPEP